MNKRISTLFLGFSIAAVIMVVVGIFLGRSDTKPTPPPVEEGVTTEKLTELKSQTTGLNLRNFGDLPKTVNNDEIGKEDPFGSY